MIRMTKIKITDYRGIHAIEADVSGAGAIAEGRNGSGKTTVLNAIGAALAANDIGPDAVRLGAESGEILIDLDRAGQALRVRRKFGPSGSSLTVTNADGDKKAKPSTLLGELLGSAPVDVIAMVLEKDPKKRRELILQALPVRATVEQLRRWVPNLPESFDVSGHGLEVVERLRKGAYEKRTEANKVAKAAADEARRLSEVAAAQRANTPETGASVVETGERLEKAQSALLAISARRDAAKRALAAQAYMRQQVADLRASAEESRKVASQVPSQTDLNDAWQLYTQAGNEVRRLEAALEQAKADLATKDREYLEIKRRLEVCEHARHKATVDEELANKIEAGCEAALDTVTDEEACAAQAESDAAQVAYAQAKREVAASLAEQQHEDAEANAKKAANEAARLDAVVKALTTEAPAALLAESGGVKGLELDGDDVRIGGVSLDKLCGAEQVRFAARIAKALHPDVGFLVCDGLERLDPEQLDAFVEEATAGGRQLFGSRVERGDLQIVALNSAPSTDVAAEEE